MKYAANIMTTAALKAATTSIKTRGNNLTASIHKAAVGALIMSLPNDMDGHLNATPALQLVQALAAGLPRNKVIAWFAEYSNIRITVSKGKDGSMTWGCKNLSPTHAEYKAITEADVMTAIAKPYWDLNPEHDVKEVDVAALIANALKRIDAANKNGKLKADPANAIRIEALRKLVPSS
jgi:hypothetical protein